MFLCEFYLYRFIYSAIDIAIIQVSYLSLKYNVANVFSCSKKLYRFYYM